VSDLSNSPILRTIARAASLEAERKSISPLNKDNPPADDAERERRKEACEVLKQQIAELQQELAPYQISPDIGPVASQSLLSYFESEAGQHVLVRLRELGLDPRSDNYAPVPTEAGASEKLPLTGKTFEITGTLSRDRDEMKAIIEQRGGKVTSSISKHTDYLLAGEGGGSKRDKAAKLGVSVISEDEFHALIGS
jgi:DNA ligase (NAD+)